MTVLAMKELNRCNNPLSNSDISTEKVNFCRCGHTELPKDLEYCYKLEETKSV